MKKHPASRRLPAALKAGLTLLVSSTASASAAEEAYYYRYSKEMAKPSISDVGVPPVSSSNLLVPVFQARYMKVNTSYAPGAASSFAANGVAPYTWDASGLPPGTSLDTRTDNAHPTIVGTPAQSGLFPVLLTVSDAAGARAQITAYQAVDSLEGTAMSAAVVPQPLLAGLKTRGAALLGYASPSVGDSDCIEWRLKAGTLPPGLALPGGCVPYGGDVFGPDASVSPGGTGSYPGIVLTATRPATGESADTQPFSMSVTQPDITIAVTPATSEVKLGETSVVSVTARFGNVDLPSPDILASFTLQGTPPTGLSLDPVTGKFVGTASVPSEQRMGLSITVAAGGISRTSNAFNLIVPAVSSVTLKHMDCPAFQPSCNVSETTEANVEFGRPASDYMFQAAGATPGTFRLSSGSLPDGITLGGDGRLRGLSVTAGERTFSVTADGAMPSAAVTMRIGADPGPPRLCTNDPGLPSATSIALGGYSQTPPTTRAGEVYAGQAFAQPFAVCGGVQPLWVSFGAMGEEAGTIGTVPGALAAIADGNADVTGNARRYLLRGALPAGIYDGLFVGATDFLGRSSQTTPIARIKAVVNPGVPTLGMYEEAPPSRTLKLCEEVPVSLGGLYRGTGAPAEMLPYNAGIQGGPPGLALVGDGQGAFRITGVPTIPGTYDNIIAFLGVDDPSYSGKQAATYLNLGSFIVTGELPYGQTGCSAYVPPVEPPSEEPPTDDGAL